MAGGAYASSGARVSHGGLGLEKIWEVSGSREDPVHASTPDTPTSPDPPRKVLLASLGWTADEAGVTREARPKLRPIRWAVLGLSWSFTAMAGWCCGYFKVSGIVVSMSSKACRWVLVGSASIGTVAVVPAKRTWLRVSVARCSSRPRKLW